MTHTIPKIIHYCWMGGNPMPEQLKSCMESWKEHLGDYEVMCWNESNFDITINKYVQDAYEAKKWAFVSDYVRLYALYHYGGIYMDTDVRVFKDMKPFLNHGFFSSYENKVLLDMIPTGTIGAQKGHPFVLELLKEYDDRIFLKEDGTYNMETNVFYITELAKKRYDFAGKGDYQVFGEDIHIYPYEYFSGFNGEKLYGSRDIAGYDITENTYTIHEFAGSWLPPKKKKKKSLLRRIRYTLKDMIGLSKNEKY